MVDRFRSTYIKIVRLIALSCFDVWCMVVLCVHVFFVS